MEPTLLEGQPDVAPDSVECRQVEAELRRSEERFRLLVQNSSDAITVLTAHGTIRYASPATLQIVGFDPAQLIDANAFDVTHPDDMERVQAWYAALRETPGTSQPVELRVHHRNGSWRHIEAIGNNLLDDPSVRGVVVNVRDITERKTAASALRASEARFRTIFERAGMGIALVRADGGFVEANSALQEMLGYTLDELRELELTDYTHPDDYAADAALYAEMVAGKRSHYQLQKRYIRKDGQVFWGRLTVSLIDGQAGEEQFAVVMVEDITAQVESYRLLEERVAERTRELTTLLEVSHSVASTLEPRPLLALILEKLGMVADYAGSSITVLEGEEFRILDSRMADGEHPEEILQLRFPIQPVLPLWEILNRMEPVIIDDVRSDAPHARVYQAVVGDRLTTAFRHVRSWIAVPMALQNRVIGFLSLSKDRPGYFSERHAKLAMAIASQAAVAIENAGLFEQGQELAVMMERQRLARELHDSVSQALYGIALGARTARMLLDRDPTKLAQPLDYVLSLAEAGLHEMRALIFNLRPEALETEGLVVALTKQAASLRTRHQLEVITDLCEEPEVRFDIKEALYRIAQEAMHNTVKHAHATRVEIRLGCDPRIVELDVRDDGSGFDPGGSFPGHMGLRSMRERVHRLGGSLTVESAPGQGVHIKVRIPRRAA